MAFLSFLYLVFSVMFFISISTLIRPCFCDVFSYFPSPFFLYLKHLLQSIAPFLLFNGTFCKIFSRSSRVHSKIKINWDMTAVRSPLFISPNSLFCREKGNRRVRFSLSFCPSDSPWSRCWLRVFHQKSVLPTDKKHVTNLFIIKLFRDIETNKI